MDNFVGFKWFAYLFQNAATRADIVRVIKNTLAMSALNMHKLAAYDVCNIPLRSQKYEVQAFCPDIYNYS